ncbi:MAG: hypothetical protein ACO1OB_10250 [Archangium sp.]
MLRHLAVVLVLVTSGAAHAQELPDAGLPDASVGEGGADRESEESDLGGGPCLTSNECTMGFSCMSGRCVPAPVTNAGCSAMPSSVLAVLGALFLVRRRA